MMKRALLWYMAQPLVLRNRWVVVHWLVEVWVIAGFLRLWTDVLGFDTLTMLVPVFLWIFGSVVWKLWTTRPRVNTTRDDQPSIL